jgi:hypothetical protein
MPGVTVHVLLQDADPGAARERPELLPALPARAELLRYDLIVFGDADPMGAGLGRQAMKDLVEFVRERGGGLVVQPGPRHGLLALKDTPLADVLPVEITADRPPVDAERTAGFRPVLTPLGRFHPSFRFSPDEKENDEVWGRLREVYWFAEGFRPKKAAEVLAVHPRGRQPLIVQQYVGAGRCLFLGLNETWRWAYREDVQRYNQFWAQTVRYLSRSRQGRIELRLDKQSAYQLGEPIKVALRFPDDAPAPPEGLEVRVAVEHRPPPGVKAAPPTVLRLEKARGARLIYEAVHTAKAAGEYRFVLSEPRPDGPAVRAEARVLAPPGERDLLRAAEAEMRRAAEESGGRFYGLEDAGRLPADLPRR